MSIFDSIYARSPVFVQHAAVTAYGLYWRQLRFGPGYAEHVREYQEREKFPAEEWLAWQAKHVNEILPICADHVPYYRDHWTQAQKRSASTGNLSALPLLEKDPIRADPKAFLREDERPSHPKVFLTSGSTGTPISSYFTVSEVRQSLALREARSARWAGVSFSIPRATFSGRMVVPRPDSKGPFHRFNAVEKQVYFSAFHLRADTAYEYIDAVRRHNVQWGTGYAVSFYLLARFMLERNIPAPKLRAIITTSEKLTPEMRAVMTRAYKCKVFEEYSTVENAIFASECECGRLHVSPDVAIVEILRPDGSPCDCDEVGEVVVTTLLRAYQPLIRFRLGDLAMWDAEPCPCKRQMPVIKEVVGRLEDIVVGPDGRQMVRFHGLFVNQPHIREGQVIQEALDQIRIRVVPTADFNENDVNEVVHRVQQRLGSCVTVSVETVTVIPRTAAGKFRAVISNLKQGVRG